MKTSLLQKSLILAALLTDAGCGGTPSASETQGGQASLAPTPEAKAAMELGSAQTLEKSRKTKQALDGYRRIIEKYPDSPQAKIAAERVKSLGSKPSS
jgi:hypothetical protein